MSDEIDKFFEEKMIFRKEYIHDVINDAQSFISHIYNNRCLVSGPSGKLRCRMPDYFGMTQNNTQQRFVYIPNNISYQCCGRLENFLKLAIEIRSRAH